MAEPNIAASVHQRLLNRAQAMGLPYNELRQRFVMERFLHRLASSPHRHRFVLKGALMMLVWRAPVTRPTKDIDLLGRMSNDPTQVVAALQEVCRTTVVDDGLSFDPNSVRADPITEDADYVGLRVKIEAAFGNGAIPVQIDIGFGDAVSPAAVPIVMPTLLDFPAPSLLGYNRESSIAEKLQAMISRGELTSRMKDFYDIWQLSCSFAFEGGALLDAVKCTFERRGTAMPAAPMVIGPGLAEATGKRDQWSAFRHKSRLQDAPEAFADLLRDLQVFIGPICEAAAGTRRQPGAWLPGGPWT